MTNRELGRLQLFDDRSAGEDPLRRTIQKHYTEVAQRESKGCCGDGACGANAETPSGRLYSADQLKLVPSDSAAASAGCGNPTAFAEIKPGDTVVDLGSGGGIDCFLAAKAVGPAGQVVGLDMTPAMVELARKNADKLGLKNVAFRLAQIETIPLPSESVDVIMSNCVINLSTQKEMVFADAYRVLKPGGKLFVSDMVLIGELPKSLAEDPEMWSCCVGGAIRKDLYLDMVQAAGFTDLTTISEVASPAPEGAAWAGKIVSLSFRASRPG